MKPGDAGWPQLLQEIARGTRLPLSLTRHSFFFKEVWLTGEGTLHCELPGGTKVHHFDQLRHLILDDFPELAKSDTSAKGTVSGAGAEAARVAEEAGAAEEEAGVQETGPMPAQPASSQPTPAAAAGGIMRLVQDVSKRLRGGSAAEEQDAAQQPSKQQAVQASTGRPAATARNGAQQLQQDPATDPSPSASPSGRPESDDEQPVVAPAPHAAAPPPAAAATAAPAAAAAAPPAAVPDPLAAAMELLTYSSASASELGRPARLQSAAQVIPCRLARTYIHTHFTYKRLAGHEHHLQLQDLVLGHNLELLKMVICCWLATKGSAHEVALEPEVLADRLQVPLSVPHRLQTAIANALLWGDFDYFMGQLTGAGAAAAPAARNQLYPSAGLLSRLSPLG